MITPVELHWGVVECLGEYEILESYREGSSRTGVWRIRSKTEKQDYFVKSHSRKTRWHPEVFAYEN